MATSDQLDESCYDSKYRNSMSESQDDELFTYDIMSSSNCEYLLIRNPSTILSFYSISDESIIEKWEIYNDSIWFIYSSNDTQTISISNTGCLTWSTDDHLILHEICSNSLYSSNININTTIPNHSTTPISVEPLSNNPLHYNSNNNMNTIQEIVTNPIIWIPISIGIIGAIFVICCLFINRFFTKNDKTINNENISSNNSNKTPNKKVISNILNDEDMGKNMMYIEENNGIDIELDNDFDIGFDLRGCHPVSQDIFVQNAVISPVNRCNDDDDNNNYIHDEEIQIKLPQIEEQI